MEEARKRFRELAKEQAGKQAKSAKHEVGEIILDATGEYFEEEMKARRRRDMARGFAMGVGVGFVLRHVMRR